MEPIIEKKEKKRITQKQRRVAKLIVENQTLAIPKEGGEIVESSGYSTSIQKNPGVVLNSEGVREALKELGFNEDNAKRVVGEILDNPDIEPNARLKSADMIFKVHGTYAPEKSINVEVQVKGDPKKLELAKEYERKLKEQL